MYTLILKALAKPLLVIGIVVGFGLGCVLYGQHLANQKHEAAALKKKVRDLTVITMVTESDSAKLAKQQQLIEDLKKEIEDGKAKLSAPDTACFDTDDVDQLRKLWRGSSGRP